MYLHEFEEYRPIGRPRAVPTFVHEITDGMEDRLARRRHLISSQSLFAE